MCGIAGMVRLRSEVQVRLEDVACMTAIMRHRGPDDEGLLGFDPSVGVIECYGRDTPLDVRRALPRLADFCGHLGQSAALGHRRLSIVDTSPAGHQPMACAGGRHWIVFNGEVYNYVELRQELEREGCTFRTGTDTEVIAAAYGRWGADCLRRFNGMWAIAILDIDAQRLFLARDRFGIKPLYYTFAGGAFLFASEIKALLAHPAVSTQPCLDYLREFMVRGAMEYRHETAFSGIYRFPMASFATVDLRSTDVQLRPTKFWGYSPNTSCERFDPARATQIAEEYYDLLKDAVRLRLRSDVPVGSALSGGLDSSAIVFLVNQLIRESGSGARQVAFSTVHRDPATRHCDESEHISAIVSELDIESHTVEPDPREIPSLHERAVWGLECPYDGTGMPGMYVFGLARANHVTVTLDGQGADEQQAGYLHYFSQHAANERPYEIVRSLCGKEAMPGSKANARFGAIVGLARSVLGRATLVRLGSLFGKDVARYLEPLNSRLKSDCQTGLVNLIHYADSRSMLSSVESRMPFMDYRLVEFTASIPACYKIHDGWTKHFARLAFNGKLPDSITWRRDKLGWPMPDDYWFRGPLKKWCDSTIRGSSLLDELGINTSGPCTPLMTIRRLNVAVWEKVFWTGSAGALYLRDELSQMASFPIIGKRVPD